MHHVTSSGKMMMRRWSFFRRFGEVKPVFGMKRKMLLERARKLLSIKRIRPPRKKMEGPNEYSYQASPWSSKQFMEARNFVENIRARRLGMMAMKMPTPVTRASSNPMIKANVPDLISSYVHMKVWKIQQRWFVSEKRCLLANAPFYGSKS